MAPISFNIILRVYGAEEKQWVPGLNSDEGSNRPFSISNKKNCFTVHDKEKGILLD